MKVQHQGLPHTRIALNLVLLLAFTALLAIAPVTRPPNAYAVEIYEVNSNGDDGDANIGDGSCADASGHCTLRAAIQEANSTPGLDEIDFAIPSEAPITTCLAGTPPTTICPTYTLPTISAPLIVDGRTQTGFTGTPIIELDGHNANDGAGVGPGVDALLVTAAGSEIYGLWIHGFTQYGIDLRSASNFVQGNWIGDVVGLTDSRYPNTNGGISIDNVAANHIGGTTPENRNVISGNGINSTTYPGYGVTISGASASGNFVQGNYIGTDPAGTLDKGNTKAGVYINGAPNNAVGGTDSTTPGGPCTGACNLISGNNGGGIEITGAAATGNEVKGNFIGTTADGLAARSNTGNGVYINGASNNIIGGTTTSARNVISKNSGIGLRISGSSTGNVIQGNYIGTDAPGTADLGNSSDGVYIAAPGNTVGGTTGVTPGGACAGACNLVSGNGRGIAIYGSSASGNIIRGNYIGTDATGTANVQNSGDGVYISGSNNTIGGTTAAACNVIAYNGTTSSGDGMDITGSTAQGNLLQGNRIGVNVSGTAAGNFANGIRISAAQKNTIGGPTLAERNLIVNNGASGVDISGTNAKENVVRGNVISSNSAHGVHVNGGSATLNIVAGNLIGTEETGTAARGNGSEGVYIENAPSNTVGGTAASDGNVVSDNGRGVTIYGAAATGNLVQGNFIGTDITGTITDPDATPGSGDELGNVGDGVFISSAPGNTIGGTAAGARNVISGNSAVGVEIYDAASGNYVVGNYIGTNLAGTAALGNAADGVFINNARSNVIGGTTAAARNVISANYNGVNISGIGATNNVIQGNHIGTNAAGTSTLGNTFDGVRAGADSSNTSVGGTLAGAGNTIAFNGGDGVLVDRSTGNGILGNSIFSNTGDPPLSYGLGIELVTAQAGLGPNDNDPGDGDSGGNNYQNFPELGSALHGSTSTLVHGTFNSTPSTNNFRLEFFVNESCDPSGYGEGKQYLGFTTVNTNASGDTTINVTFPTAVPVGWSITATATDPANNTSEFSQCVPVTAPPAPPSGDVNSDGNVSMVDAMLIAQCVAGLIDCDTISEVAADVNCDGNISMVDTMRVAQYVAGIIHEFTCS